MGINLIWVCSTHRRYHYSMRGEEGIDFQGLIVSENDKGCPAQCFREGAIRVYRDADFDTSGLEDIWEEWDDRPAEVLKRRLAVRG